jgi:hypothetical protein
MDMDHDHDQRCKQLTAIGLLSMLDAIALPFASPRLCVVKLEAAHRHGYVIMQHFGCFKEDFAYQVYVFRVATKGKSGVFI